MKYLSLFSGIGGLYNSGMSQKELAVYYKISQPQICRIMKKLGIKSRVAKKRNQYGSNNDSWKGNKASYAALHYRVEKVRGKPSKCSMCETEKAKRYEWANMTGRYEYVYDYIRLCKSCHSKFDNVIINLIKKRT